MDVAAIIKRKGSEVISVTHDQTVSEAVATMTQRKVGAVLVLANGDIVGILSERDVVRCVSTKGAQAMALPVGSLMTRSVKSCSPSDSIGSIMQMMTEGRFRHLPVVSQGQVVGTISIGDVVKHRLDETEMEAENLRGYMANFS